MQVNLARMKYKVGVCAIQGDFEKHILSLKALGVEAKEVRTLQDLDQVERLIIPGGESTTVGLLMERYGMGRAIQERAAMGMPIWGTCMGMILLAKEVEDREQYRLGLMDISVKRNAFGAQIHSFEDTVSVKGLDVPVLGVFIRAPIVSKTWGKCEVIATYEDKIVGVRQGKLLGTAFHPEMTDDTRMHSWFLSI